MPKSNPTPPLASAPRCEVHFRRPYGDFPGYQAGDVEKNPSPEMIDIARRSANLTLVEIPSAAPDSPIPRGR